MNFFEDVMKLLGSNDKKVQDQALETIFTLYKQETQVQELKKLFYDIAEFLKIQIIKAPEDYQQAQILRSQLLEMLLKMDIPNLKNHIKVIEPMFQCNYTYTNDKNVMIQGFLSAFNFLSEKNPEYDVKPHVHKCFNHTNKYVRKSGVDLAVQILQSIYDEYLFQIILDALQDESIEVRKAALRFYQCSDDILIPNLILIQKKSSIGLLLNAHMENLIDDSLQICKRVYQSDSPNPIYGVIQFVKQYCFDDAIQLLYEYSLSRYYQIRCSAVYTLQSLFMFTKEEQLINKDFTIRVLLNDSLFEQDPQVRQVGLKSLSNLIKYYQLPSETIDCIAQCAGFHMCDVPMSCKENSCIILSQIYFTHQDMIKNIMMEKFSLIRDREKMFLDFVGVGTPEEIEKQIGFQGGKEKVTNKHIANLNLGFSLLFKYLSKGNLQQVSTFLKQILTEITYTLRQKYIYQDGLQEYKYLTYYFIAESLQNLKSVKRLPIQTLDESGIFEIMAVDIQGIQKVKEILPIIGAVVGESILKGRLDQFQ